MKLARAPSFVQRLRLAYGKWRRQASLKVGAGYLQGCDVSQYQPTVVWPRVKEGGVRFVYVRAMFGTWYYDPACVKHVRGAMDAQLDTGIYIYWLPHGDQEKTAKTMSDMHKALGCTLPIAVDVEATDLEGRNELKGMPVSEVQLALARFLTALEALGHDPIIYTFPYYWPSWPAAYKKYRLWIAHYGVSKPKLPKPWKEWTFWQYAGNDGTVAGVMGPCDMNAFNGDSLNEVRVDLDR